MELRGLGYELNTIMVFLALTLTYGPIVLFALLHGKQDN